MAGYSSSNLEKKLGLKAGYSVSLINVPANYRALFAEFPEDLIFDAGVEVKKQFIHVFITASADLGSLLQTLRDELTQNGMIWVSWPKKASGVLSDVTEDIIRREALTVGLVDVKVCAVDETWSGLKLVIPLKNRKVQPRTIH